MSRVSGDSAKRSTPAISSLGLLLWLGLQVGALALVAGRVPLYAEYPQPGEFHATVIVTAVQWLGVHQSPFQRRKELADLHIGLATAGRGTVVRNLDAADARRLAHELDPASWVT